MWPDDETPEPAAWINFNAATGERNHGITKGDQT
jgi:hypothetical protein